MKFLKIIEKKRDGFSLSESEIKFAIQAYVEGQAMDYQMSALVMAMYLNGMTADEIAWLTNAMLKSGKQIDLSSISAIKVDKHSTGGVGDKVSLILAPMVASLGVPVPMISGRGLGYSGGTLDKLESIPGFDVNLSIDEFISEIQEIGVSLIGQTDDIVPADKKIYALRDATATVNSLPLITASIMSKKIAEGANGLVLDVKFGKGAFYETETEAIDLARSLISIGQKFNLPTTAILTSMNQPLGLAVGNWLETREAIAALQNHGPQDLMDVTYALGALMLVTAEKAASVEEGYKKCYYAIKSGAAFEKFLQIVKWQRGNIDFIRNPQRYPKSRYSLTIKTRREGYILSIDARQIGLVSMQLGAGRAYKEDKIDYTAGILLHKKQGDALRIGDTLAIAYSNDKEKLIQAKSEIEKAYKITTNPITPERLITRIVDEDGVRDWPYAF